MGRWNDVPGAAFISICWDELVEEEKENPHELQLLVLEAILKDTNNIKINPEEEFKDAEIEIRFASSGYYSEAKTYGPPEDCYPEEGEEERELVWVTITTEKYVISLGNGELAERFFDKYNDNVENVNLDYENYG